MAKKVITELHDMDLNEVIEEPAGVFRYSKNTTCPWWMELSLSRERSNVVVCFVPEHKDGKNWEPKA